MTGKGAPGRVAVVTGANGGIGRGVALALAGQGMDLWLLARNAETLEATAVEARRRGVMAQAFALDIRDDAELERFRKKLQDACDGVDLLVHSAGAHFMGAVATAPVAQLDEQYRVNLRGPYLLTQLLLPLLRKRRGDVVFVNSSAGLESRAMVGAYAATKHGLKALADALRQEMNAEGIRVLSVYPGRTATPLQETLHAEEGKPYSPGRLLQVEDVAAAVVQALALPRTAEVTDIRLRPMQAPAPKR